MRRRSIATDRGTSDYNALQVKLEHRYTHGFQYLISYTWSKSLDAGGERLFRCRKWTGWQFRAANYYDVRERRAVSSYDIPHFLSIGGLYELPFGQGKQYLTHGIGSFVLGSWQLNTVAQVRSGRPYNLSVTGDVANIGSSVIWWNYARPNQIANPNPSHPTAKQWYDPATLAVPSSSYGDFPRNSLRTSHAATADASLFKNFTLKEQLALKFRAEVFNIFNIQDCGAPDTTIGDPGAGPITSNVLPPRQIQLGLHLSF